MEKVVEMKGLELLWKTIDDRSIFRDVLFKGKYIQNAMRFIAERNSITIEESKEICIQVCDELVISQIQQKQPSRASHILKNAQINEEHYLFALYVDSNDDSIKDMLYQFLIKHNNDFKEEEISLKAYYSCFKLFLKNIENHGKYLDNINRIHNNFQISIHNVNKLTFPKFMQQSVQWRNDLSIDVFFKSKRDEKNLDLLPILDKTCFFSYIMHNELSGLVKQWLNEQYLCKAGKPINSTLPTELHTFDDALNHVFRSWKFEEQMMNQISKRHKDVLKNEFAKLGLFEARESKQLDKKFNRFFTTHTYQENYPTLKSNEVTTFVLDNNLVCLMPQPFIDHNYIQKILKENEENADLHPELVLLQSTKDLLTKQTNLQSFVDIMNVTSTYIQSFNTSFNTNQHELRFMNEIVSNNLEKHDQIADINPFLKNLFVKLTTKEDLPSIEELLENFHSIKLDYIRDEFEGTGSDSIPSFNDPNLSSTYGEKADLDYMDYVKRYQGVYATYIFVLDSIKNSMAVTRPMILDACEEVTKLALNNPNDLKLIRHSVAFLESFSIDTRNLRCFIQLQKLKANNNDHDCEGFLDKTVKMTTNEEDIKNVESLEVFWKVKKYVNPKRSYLNPFTEKDDWFRIILMAQYFNYSVDAFISICQERIKDKTLCDNLIRAVRYEAAPESEYLSLSSTPKYKGKTSEAKKLFGSGQYLDSKFDLFAILLKCNENINRRDCSFEEFQRFFMRDEPSSDLLYQAIIHDWPVIAVLAGTTKLYRFKYCWLTWLILSSNYKWYEKFEDVEGISTSVFEHCLRNGFVKTLDESFQIFYPEAPMKIFTKFLKDSANGKLKDMESILKNFIVQIIETDYRTKIIKEKHRLIPCIIRYLIIHLQNNIKFSTQQQEYLACVHRSEIAKFDGKVNFELIRNFCKILEHTSVEMNYEVFYESDTKVSKEIDRICDELISNNYFEAAIEIGNLMNKSKTEFIFKYWLHLRKTDNQKQTSFDIAKYMKYVKMYRLNMDLFIKFLKREIDEMDQCIEKYNLMFFMLRNTPKADPKELNELEYELICLYLRLKISGVKDIKPVTSLYYENVIKPESSLIHNSLYELKAIAMIDDLNDSQCLTDDSEIQQLDDLMSFLLDINDIVQVLRLQAMFGHAPEDLKILVYMLSVAEGITSIYDITKKERQAISNCGPLSSRFNRFAFRSFRQSISNSISLNSSTISMDMNESSIIEEPTHYKENKETLQALQGLLYKLKHGIKYAQRVVFLYRISLFLHNQSFEDLIKIKNSYEFLEIVSESDCDNKLLAMSDIIEAMEMTREEVAKFIAKEITACIIKTRFQQFTKDTETSTSNLNMTTSISSTWSGSKHVLDDIWGFSLSNDLHLILELCKGKTTLLGTYLIKFYKILSQAKSDIPIIYESFENELKSLTEDLNRSLPTQLMSLKKKNIIRVELLITAHDCFCQECSTEGIGDVLNLSKVFINELAEMKNYNLIVKLMCGIGRYREMFYCFDILIKNEAFEALLGQFNDKQTNGLKNALLSYLNEYHPDNKEYFKMCASHFLMYTELAKIWKNNAMTKIQKLLTENQVKLNKSGLIISKNVQQIEVPYLKCTKNVLDVLNEAIKDMIHATEMMTADQKIEMSLKYSSFCELIAMQYHLVKVGTESELKICPCVIYQEQNAEKSQLIAQYLANYELSVPQMMILNKNAVTPIDYTLVIYCRSIIAEDEQFLHDFVGRLDLTDRMIEKVIKLAQFDKISDKNAKILQELCMMVRDVGVKFNLASLFGCKTFMNRLLNDEQSYYYLLDSNYGSKDIFGI
ncbi:spatacsin [Chironomus tepperi]|uniref:spatacsin n=1 Tax=Chironomus tepperi TaxID=113505 RepID=UPI00391F1D06